MVITVGRNKKSLKNALLMYTDIVHFALQGRVFHKILYHSKCRYDISYMVKVNESKQA